MHSKFQIRAINRIYKDLQEIEDNPIQGLSICIPDESNPFSLHCNILILSGIYEGIMLHLHMTIPENYPLNAPKMKITPGQCFDNKFHHHIFGNVEGGFTICIDLLDHGYFFKGESGWSPAYTLSTILVQMQSFFSENHDLSHLPSESQINELRAQMEKYTYSITLRDNTTIIHSYHSPFPPLPITNIPTIIQTLIKNDEEIKINLKEVEKMKKTKEKFFCFLTKITPEDNISPLGYPLNVKINKIGINEIVPIMELLSYEGFNQLVESSVDYEKNLDHLSFKTTYGKIFNYWIPLYINEKHFEKFKENYKDAILVLKYGISKVKHNKLKYVFDENLIYGFFPKLLNNMMNSLKKSASYQTIEGYCQFMRLFLRFLKEFPKLQIKINEKVKEVILNRKEKKKRLLSHKKIGKFLILLSLSKFKTYEKQFLVCVIKESIAQTFRKQTGLPSTQELAAKLASTNKFYKEGKQNYDLMLFFFKASKLFLPSQEEFVQKIDGNYGVMDEDLINEFLKHITYIRSSILNFEQLFEYIELNEKIVDLRWISNFFWEAYNCQSAIKKIDNNTDISLESLFEG